MASPFRQLEIETTGEPPVVAIDSIAGWRQVNVFKEAKTCYQGSIRNKV
jgi:hypothetical protein